MRLALILLAIGLLGGCQQLTHQPASPYAAATLEQKLAKLSHWQAQGKIAVKTADDSHSASFTWQQQEGAYHIHIFGPFGQGSTHLRRNRRDVTIENSDIGKRRAASAELLMQDLLGWYAPVSALQYWIKGLPSPASAARTTRAADELITSIEQDGWTVEYTEYQQLGRWRLPAKISAQRADLRLRIVIRNWQL